MIGAKIQEFIDTIFYAGKPKIAHCFNCDTVFRIKRSSFLGTDHKCIYKCCTLCGSDNTDACNSAFFCCIKKECDGCK